MRSRPEWIGKSDDAMPPPSVRLRIFEDHDGRCHLTGRKIRPGEAWDLDHIKPLWDGGENRESNLAPALRKAHLAKSAKDRTTKAKSDQVKKKHYGVERKRGFRGWRKFNGEIVYRDER